MRSTRTIRQLGLGAAVALLTILNTTGVGLGLAHRKPSVRFSIAADQTAGNTERFTYGVRNAPHGSTLAFQAKSVGGSWRTTKKLRSRSGTTDAPALGIDLYTVRVAVLRNGRVLAQKQQTIYVYGDIPLANLCDAPNVEWGNNDGGCSPSTAQVGAFLFQSAATFDAPGSTTPSAPAANLTVTPSTSCRTLHLDYGESNADVQHAGGNTMITQSVIQSNTQPNTVTFPGGALQHTDIKLDGGPFQITDGSTFTGEGSLGVLENGQLN